MRAIVVAAWTVVLLASGSAQAQHDTARTWGNLHDGWITYRVIVGEADVDGKPYSEDALRFVLKRLMHNVSAIHQSMTGVYLVDVDDLPSGFPGRDGEGATENLQVVAGNRTLPDLLRGKSLRMLSIPAPIGYVRYEIDSGSVTMAGGLLQASQTALDEQSEEQARWPITRTWHAMALEGKAFVDLEEDGIVTLPYFEPWILGLLGQQLNEFVSAGKPNVTLETRALTTHFNASELLNEGWQLYLGEDSISARYAKSSYVPGSWNATEGYDGILPYTGERDSVLDALRNEMGSPTVVERPSFAWGPFPDGKQLFVIAVDPRDVSTVAIMDADGKCLTWDEPELEGSLRVPTSLPFGDCTLPHADSNDQFHQRTQWRFKLMPDGVSLQAATGDDLLDYCLTLSLERDGLGHALGFPFLDVCASGVGLGAGVARYMQGKGPVESSAHLGYYWGLQTFTLSAGGPGPTLTKAGANGCPWSNAREADCGVRVPQDSGLQDSGLQDSGLQDTLWTWKLHDISGSGRANEGLFQVQRWEWPAGGLIAGASGEDASVSCLRAESSGVPASGGRVVSHAQCDLADPATIWRLSGRADGYFQVEALGRGLCWHLANDLVLLPCDPNHPSQAWAPDSECVLEEGQDDGSGAPTTSSQCVQSQHPAVRRPDGEACREDRECQGTCRDEEDEENEEDNRVCGPPADLGGPCDTPLDCSRNGYAVCSDGVCAGSTHAPCTDNANCDAVCAPTIDYSQHFCGPVRSWGMAPCDENSDCRMGLRCQRTDDVEGYCDAGGMVAAGLWHTCALLETGTVVCWGSDQRGQLGNDGDYTDQSRPVTVADIGGTKPSAVAIAAGHMHTCALLETGAAKCWGDHGYGQLGNGDDDTIQSIPIPVPVNDIGGTDPSAVALAAGTSHTCALLETGAVKCWGKNYKGQLGYDGEELYKSEPVDVQYIGGDGQSAVAIAAGGSHTCALLETGAVKCWGDDGYGQLGDGVGNTNQSRPVDVRDIDGTTEGASAVAIAAGDSHTCALLETGAVKCWGLDGSGQIGDGGEDSNRSTPEAVVGIDGDGESAVAMTAGAEHTCALLIGGGVKCWGRDGTGQLGDSDERRDQSTPVPVVGFPCDENSDCRMGLRCVPTDGSQGYCFHGAAMIAAGYLHTCAVLMSGALKCWGTDTYGQIGDGDDTEENRDELIPVRVYGLYNGVKAVAAGQYHTCALLDTGALECWGSDSDGQLGDDSEFTDKNIPVQVYRLNNGVKAVAAGQNHTCALLDTGALRCWGDDRRGQVGDGNDNTDKNIPVGVHGYNGGVKVKAVAAGQYHTCALLDSGALECWGSDSDGQLGNGDDNTDKNIPGPVYAANSGVKAVAAGYRHTCALLDTGVLECWGNDSKGQLGDGDDNTNKNIPKKVLGLDGVKVKAVATGQYHTCALLDSGALKCWGADFEGQLGDGGERENQDTPVDVVGLSE